MNEFALYANKPCHCGSNLRRFPNFDARGIFLNFTCDFCHEKKMAKYRPEVLTNPSYQCEDCPIDPID
jgi:hypothetical protein